MKNNTWIFICLTILVCTIIACTTMIYLKHVEIKEQKNTYDVNDLTNDIYNSLLEGLQQSK